MWRSSLQEGVYDENLIRHLKVLLLIILISKNPFEHVRIFFTTDELEVISLILKCLNPLYI